MLPPVPTQPSIEETHDTYVLVCGSTEARETIPNYPSQRALTIPSPSVPQRQLKRRLNLLFVSTIPTEKKKIGCAKKKRRQYLHLSKPVQKLPNPSLAALSPPNIHFNNPSPVSPSIS
jgi:hypothetical protein